MYLVQDFLTRLRKLVIQNKAEKSLALIHINLASGSHRECDCKSYGMRFGI